jgi:hypothetical protein
VVADRTLVTELGTALGTLPLPDLASAVASRSDLLRVDARTWDQLASLYADGSYRADFLAAYGNGQAFAAATDGLAGRPPHLVEWTGGRRPGGDEVAPIDLRIDHVYLISCKYLSANIANPSPGRLFDGLLATTGTWEHGDWYAAVAAGAYQDLYDACRSATGRWDLPPLATDLSTADRERLRRALPGRLYPEPGREPYRRLCAEVSERSAERWRMALQAVDPERMLCRLLRIGSAPYFLLGAHGPDSLRIRVDTPLDWHDRFRCTGLTVTAARAGQPRVDWQATYVVRATGAHGQVDGHVEIRWSHGRFGQPPEAKVYLDTPVAEVPGYNPLEPAGDRQGALGQGRFPVTAQ